MTDTVTDLDARRVDAGALPVVDMSGLYTDDPGARAEVAAALRAACVDKGFFYVAGHGIEPELRAAAFAEARLFFALPAEAKHRVAMTGENYGRGYEDLGGQTLEVGAPPDLKEGYYLGRETRDDGTVPTGDAGMGFGPNLWPDRAEFREVLTEYHRRLTAVATLLMEGLALSLDLPADHFTDFCADAAPSLRILHYPPQPANPRPGEKGAGAHTDWGGITLLAQDENGGLQVLGDDGWVHAAPIPDTFVVNLGDLMARWTNDRYRSTLHRVVNASGAERYSMPFFFSGRPDAEIETLPTCRVPGEPDRYPPTTPAKHTREKQQETYEPTP
jgi:isopenicillin N synthase-like dioxygenase